MSTTTPVTYAVWNPPGALFPIRYSLALFREIDFFVGEGYRRIPHGGLEVGGVLYGHGEPSELLIEAYRPVESQHSFGPSFTLSPADLEQLGEQVAKPLITEAGYELEVVGWLISNCRSDLVLTEQEARIYDEYFPGPRQVTLLAKPEKLKPTRYGFLARPRRGGLLEKACRDSFILPLSTKGEATTVLDTHRDGASVSEPAAVPIPKIPLVEVQPPAVIPTPPAPVMPAPVIPAPVIAMPVPPPPPTVLASVADVAPTPPAPTPRAPEPNLKPVSVPPPLPAPPPTLIEPELREPISPPPAAPPPAARPTPEALPPAVSAQPKPKPSPTPLVEAAPPDQIGAPPAAATEAPVSLPSEAVESDPRPVRERIADTTPADRRPSRSSILMLQPEPPASETQPEAPLEPAYEPKQARTSLPLGEIALAVAILAILAAAVIWTYLRMPASPIPLNAEVQANQVVVTWPAELTKSADRCSITTWINGQPSSQVVSADEQADGKATIQTTSPDVTIQLHAPRWYQERVGQIRVFRIVPPPPPPAPPRPVRRVFSLPEGGRTVPPIVGRPADPVPQKQQPQ
jgi:hypothetical protein